MVNKPEIRANAAIAEFRRQRELAGDHPHDREPA